MKRIFQKACYVKGIFGWFLTDRIHFMIVPTRLFCNNSDNLVVEWCALKYINLLFLYSKGILSCIYSNNLVRKEVDDLSLCKDK